MRPKESAQSQNVANLQPRTQALFATSSIYLSKYIVQEWCLWSYIHILYGLDLIWVEGIE